MSFTSPTEQFKSYQAFSSGSSSSKQPAQSFSSRVDFSDQSYDMPYFTSSDASVLDPQTNYGSTAPKPPVADVSRGFTPKQLSDAPKTKSFDKKRLSSVPNPSQQGTYALLHVNLCTLLTPYSSSAFATSKGQDRLHEIPGEPRVSFHRGQKDWSRLWGSYYKSVASSRSSLHQMEDF